MLRQFWADVGQHGPEMALNPRVDTPINSLFGVVGGSLGQRCSFCASGAREASSLGAQTEHWPTLGRVRSNSAKFGPKSVKLGANSTALA